MNILHLVRKQATKQQALHQAQVLLAASNTAPLDPPSPGPAGAFLALKLAQFPWRARLSWRRRGSWSRCCT